jgi:hypothetical protein
LRIRGFSGLGGGFGSLVFGKREVAVDEAKVAPRLPAEGLDNGMSCLTVGALVVAVLHKNDGRIERSEMMVASADGRC